MSGITIKIRKADGTEVDGQPYGIQFTAEGTFMTVKAGEDIVRIVPPRGLMFNSDRGWYIS